LFFPDPIPIPNPKTIPVRADWQKIMALAFRLFGADRADKLKSMPRHRDFDPGQVDVDRRPWLVCQMRA